MFFHDVRSGGGWDERFIWVLLNSGSNVRRRKSTRKITWARSYIRGDDLWMDLGRDEAVKLPQGIRDTLWNGTTREWPLMAADLSISRDTLMAHYLSNHISVAYGDIFADMAAVSQELGFHVRILEDKA